jgi:AcrR family transcriptional regulator
MPSTPSSRPARGRPRRASRDILEEAAYELFLEQGYAGTTVDQIASRAGVSRGTFFNYFTAKSDVFWTQVDDAVAELPGYLAASDPSLPPLRAIGEALADVAGHFGPDRVPWILNQYEVVGSAEEVQASAIRRLTRNELVLRHFTAARLGTDADALLPRVIATTAIGAATAAVLAWAGAGPGRGALEPYLLRALAPLADGFERSS